MMFPDYFMWPCYVPAPRTMDARDMAGEYIGEIAEVSEPDIPIQGMYVLHVKFDSGIRHAVVDWDSSQDVWGSPTLAMVRKWAIGRVCFVKSVNSGRGPQLQFGGFPLGSRWAVQDDEIVDISSLVKKPENSRPFP